jgi:hypothetical protein
MWSPAKLVSLYAFLRGKGAVYVGVREETMHW